MSCSFDLGVVRSVLAGCDVAGLDRDGVRVAVTEIRRTQRALEALNVRVATHTNRLALRGEAPETAEALLHQGEVAGSTARRDAARANTATALPRFGAALQDGTVGGDHLDAISRALNTLTTDEQQVFKTNEAELVGAAERLPVDTFNRLVRNTVDRVQADHGLGTAEQQRAGSELKHWLDKISGMGKILITLDPARYSAVIQAIEYEVTALANTTRTNTTRETGSDTEALAKTPNLAAAALVELVGHGNGSQGRAAVSLIVDAETALNGPSDHSIRETVDGLSLPPETIDRFCCDAIIRKVLIDKRGVSINVGRSVRTATDAQWAALKAMYATCGWSDCERPVSWCQAHHIKEWDQQGPTDLNNLVPLCNQHHHAVHEGKWTIHLQADRTLHIQQPDGQHHATTQHGRLGRWRRRRTELAIPSASGSPPT